jgi:hypothetical protein
VAFAWNIIVIIRMKLQPDWHKYRVKQEKYMAQGFINKK